MIFRAATLVCLALIALETNRERERAPALVTALIEWLRELGGHGVDARVPGMGDADADAAS